MLAGSSDPCSLEGLLRQHGELEQALVAYQAALMDGELARAGAVARDLAADLEVHAAVEEAVLLPLFVEAGRESEGARLELFLAEHRKLAQLAAGLVSRAAELLAQEDGGTLTAEARLAAIEAAFTLKHLLDHHTKREERVLYPALVELREELEPGDLEARLAAAHRAAAASAPGRPA